MEDLAIAAEPSEIVERAESVTSRALVLFADTLLASALDALRIGETAQAESVLRMIVGRCGRREAEAIYLLGRIALMQRRLEQAVAFLTCSLTLQPDQPAGRIDLAAALRLLGRPREAIPHLERVIALDVAAAAAYAGLAAALVALDRPSEGLAWAHAALAKAKGGSAEAAALHCDLGVILAGLEHHADAIEQFEMTLRLLPGDPRPRFHRGLVRLTLGDLPDAWADYEARLSLPQSMLSRRPFTQPMWRGQLPVHGRSILLHAEQDTRETLQFLRYVPLLARQGARVTLAVQRGLGRLCSRVAGVTQVIESGGRLPDFDLHCPLPSLPAAFATSLLTIPSSIPYLTPDPLLRAAWTRHLEPWRKMRVGLAWSGGRPAHPRRSVPLVLLHAILRREDIDCHVIQPVTTETDRAILADHPMVAEHRGKLTSLDQIAALTSVMDLVITADTEAAHLAGAIGVPAWVMLPHHAEWRWLRDRDDSPWYPGLRLFRQSARGEWATVLEHIAQNLDAWSIPQS